jgi:hypothetical protein
MSLEELAAFGVWSDHEDVSEEDEAASLPSVDSPEDEEKLVGKRRRWAPAKGLVVDLSTEAAAVLANDATKFFRGPGTICYVSLDGTEAQVEWDCKPGLKISYPTGYSNRYHLRVYEPPPPPEEDEDVQVAKPVKRKEKVPPHEKYAQLRSQREEERQKRLKLQEEARKKAER